MSRILVDLPESVSSRLALVSVLGLAPLSYLANRFDLALGFGVISLLVVFLTTTLLHLLRPLIRNDWFIVWAIMIAGFWIAVVQQILRLFHPALLQNIDFYLSVLALSPLVLVQATVVQRLVSLGEVLRESGRTMGTFVLLMAGTGLIRELLGNGSLTLVPGSNQYRLVLPWLSACPMTFLATAAGGIMLLGFIVAFAQWLRIRHQDRITREHGADAGGPL